MKYSMLNLKLLKIETGNCNKLMICQSSIYSLGLFWYKKQVSGKHSLAIAVHFLEVKKLPKISILVDFQSILVDFQIKLAEINDFLTFWKITATAKPGLPLDCFLYQN